MRLLGAGAWLEIIDCRRSETKVVANDLVDDLHGDLGLDHLLKDLPLFQKVPHAYALGSLLVVDVVMASVFAERVLFLEKHHQENETVISLLWTHLLPVL